MVVNDRTFQRNGVLNDEVVQEVEVVAARQYVVKRTWFGARVSQDRVARGRSDSGVADEM